MNTRMRLNSPTIVHHLLHGLTLGLACWACFNEIVQGQFLQHQHNRKALASGTSTSAEVVVVKTPDELTAALDGGARHIEVQSHLDLANWHWTFPSSTKGNESILSIPPTLLSLRGNCSEAFPPQDGAELLPRAAGQCLIAFPQDADLPSPHKFDVTVEGSVEGGPLWLDHMYLSSVNSGLKQRGLYAANRTLYVTNSALQGPDASASSSASSGTKTSEGPQALIAINALPLLQDTTVADWSSARSTVVIDERGKLALVRVKFLRNTVVRAQDNFPTIVALGRGAQAVLTDTSFLSNAAAGDLRLGAPYFDDPKPFFSDDAGLEFTYCVPHVSSTSGECESLEQGPVWPSSDAPDGFPAESDSWLQETRREVSVAAHVSPSGALIRPADPTASLLRISASDNVTDPSAPQPVSSPERLRMGDPAVTQSPSSTLHSSDSSSSLPPFAVALIVVATGVIALAVAAAIVIARRRKNLQEEKRRQEKARTDSEAHLSLPPPPPVPPGRAMPAAGMGIESSMSEAHACDSSSTPHPSASQVSGVQSGGPITPPWLEVESTGSVPQNGSNAGPPMDTPDTRIYFGMPTDTMGADDTFRPDAPPPDAPVEDRREYLEAQLDSLRGETISANLELLPGITSRYHGGQAVVQAAEEKGTRREYVLKFFLTKRAYEQEAAFYTDPSNAALRDFLPDLRQLFDGSSAALHDRFGQPMPPCIVMEKGEALDVWAARCKHGIDMVTGLQVIIHVSQRLEDLHEAGYVHRDLKPGNIMWLPRQNRWTLIDFGCAARIGSTAPTGFSLSYAAPEALAAHAAGQPSVAAEPALDAWSLGILALELFSGKHVFPCRASKQQIGAMIIGKVAAPWEMASAAPLLKKLGTFRRPVLEMLNRDPSQRPSISAFAQTCRLVLSSNTTT